MKDLVIQAPNQGIGPSPIKGYGDVRNLDIYTIPGVARLNNLLAKKSSSTVTNLVQWFRKNPLVPTEIFALDLGGQVYTSTDSGDTWATIAGETAGGIGQGLEIWNDYLFVCRTSAIDVYGPLAGSRAWSNSWAGLTISSDTLWHPMLVSDNDNKLYGGAGKYIFSLEEAVGTFAPGNSASYTAVSQALDLPPNYRIKCLAELGNNLMIGTWMGTNIYDFKIANVFSWDRSSTSFGAPLKINENGVNSMLNIGNALYIQAGIDGKLFLSNGVETTLIAQIPSSVANIEGGLYIEGLPGAIMNYKGRPFFGVSSGGSGATIGGMGVWSLQRTSKGNVLNYEQQISTSSDGASSVLKIGALLPLTRDTMLVGWRDDSTYGIDKTTNTSRYTTYSGYFDSPFYNVGTPLIKRQFTQGEFQLANALTTNQGIKIKYRTDLSASFTTIGTYDFATLGAVLSHSFEADIPDCEFVQIRCELTTGSSSNTSPQIKQIILR